MFKNYLPPPFPILQNTFLMRSVVIVTNVILLFRKSVPIFGRSTQFHKLVFPK